MLLSCLACCASGCGSNEPNRYEVSGTVQFDGAPVPAGYIVFEPDSAQGNRGPGGGAKIVAGRFATESGNGVVGGPHLVRIHGTDGVPVELPGEGLNTDGTVLFPDYETRVDFPRADTTHDFTVPR
jgi:hypothetical protein